MSQLDHLQELQASLQTLDLNDRSTLTTSIVSVNVAFIVLIVMTLVIRLYVRLGMIHAAGLDDGLMALAAIFAITLSGFCFLGIHYGVGKHIWNIAADPIVFLDDARGFTQALFGAFLAYATAITFTKCSIIASYLRIFRDKHFRWVIYATGFVVISLWICSVFAIVFQCKPVQAAWDWSIDGSQCFDIVKYLIIGNAVNLATDVVLLIAPLPIFWKMNMPLAQRLIVCVLFGFGGFACIASMLRLLQLHLINNVDVSYNCVTSMNWSVAEVGTAIVCASVASMRPLGQKLFPKNFFSRTLARTSRITRSVDSGIRKPSGPHPATFRFGSGETAVAPDNWRETSSTDAGEEASQQKEKVSDSGADLPDGPYDDVNLDNTMTEMPKLAGGVLPAKLRDML